MTMRDDQFPSPVEIPEDDVDQVELPLVGDGQPVEPQPDEPTAPVDSEKREGLPPIPA